MKNTKRSLLRGVGLAPLFTIWACLLGLLGSSKAQTGNVGLNTVWNSTSKVASPAFVDASAYTSQGDICANINYILTNAAAAGVIIDARGVLPTSGTSQPCSINPWTSADLFSGALPNTILLPSGTITICATWQMPVFTKLIGEGPGQGGSIGTTLQVGSSAQCGGNSFAGSAMIQMGGTTNCTSSNCFSVSISDLALDGQSNSGIDGIDNLVAQELSSVTHVAMVNIGKIGLSIAANAGNSGPYSDLSIQAIDNATASCVQINGSPRGVHGISCTCVQSAVACSNPNNAGIYVGSTTAVHLVGTFATSIEDVYVNGFKDGIYVGVSGPGSGTEAPAFDDLLFNINGGSSVTNLIHLSASQSSSSSCPPQSSPGNNVCDITIMGVTSAANNTILDEISNTTLPYSTDPTVGMYILGEQVTDNGSTVIGNSRFTTSPSIPSWIVGTTAPSTPCAIGDLYSITSGTSGYTLWGCIGPNTGVSWAAIK